MENKETRNIFNVYTGELYKLFVTELKNLLEGEVPILRQPNQSCKVCFGRGYAGYDTEKRSYRICPKCIDRQLDTKYLPSIKYTCLVLNKTKNKQIKINNINI